MIPATEAKKLSIKGLEIKSKQELEDIELKISNATKNGNSEIIIWNFLLPNTIKTLQDFGYIVEETQMYGSLLGGKRDTTRIQW